MLKINDKTFLNIQEAVQWLMDNNALPFQCTANYAANTEIGLGTIVNPTMAKVRIGSLIFFADSKVSTVTGITANGFIVSDQYNDLVDDVVYVSNVELNASGHLIVTLSNGTQIDAGLVKQVVSFSINASQHLIATYNDGTTNDLGAIFNGNVNISGNLTVQNNATLGGTLTAYAVRGDSIIETMNGYSFSPSSSSGNVVISYVYAGIVKNGNKLTLCVAMNVTLTAAPGSLTFYGMGDFVLPSDVYNALFTTNIGGANLLESRILPVFGSDYLVPENWNGYIEKLSGRRVRPSMVIPTTITPNQTYYVRYEATFLLSDNLAA